MAGEIENSPGLRIRLFGPVAIDTAAGPLGPGDLGGVRPKQVLEILLAARGHRVPTDRLAELLWGTAPPRNVAGSLQTFVSVLRRRLAPDPRHARKLIVTEYGAYRFATELADLDLDRFDELLERSGPAASHLARQHLEQALALVQGEVLEDEPYAGWAEELRGTYRGRVLGAHLEAADACLAECDYPAGLAHAQAAITLDRFSERAHRTAMLALYAQERPHQALQAYRNLHQLLDEELGLQPTPQTKALQEAILRQDDVCRLLPRDTTGPHPGGPKQRSPRLLGRTTELATLAGAARQALAGSFALVLVEGEAGSGKTRLLDELVATLPTVRAGRAACSELERHLPYVPLAQAVREALHGVDLEPARLPALREILPELTLAEPAHDFPAIDALESLVGLIAKHAPLLLLLDDLQWADPTTLAALGYLQRRLPRVPVAVVGAVQAEQAPPEHPVRLLRPTTLVRLGPLTEAELAPLGLPDLHGATGGNPRLVAAITTGTRRELTAALAELLLARCRAQGPAAHRILLAAAVLEQPFEPELLAALCRTDPAELTEELERLSERRLLRIDGFRFRFHHDLVRQVLLTSLSPARQRLLRQRAEQAERPPLSMTNPPARTRQAVGAGRARPW